MLTVMHNNRAWHQEYMFVEYMAGVRGRGADRATSAARCAIRSSTMRRWRRATAWPAKDRITDPTKLSAALKRGVASAKRGEPYMIDVITQPR